MIKIRGLKIKSVKKRYREEDKDFDFYSEGTREELVENDEISAEEAAFMEGWEKAE